MNDTVKNNKVTHKELCFDLAIAKGTKYIEVPLGSVYLNNINRGRNNLGQADVITIKPSYNNFNLDIYEVKVTRSDLMQDIKKEKYKKYLPHCNRLYFAVKSGICKKEEIPDNIGLISRGENGWKTIKTAKKREIEFSEQMLLSLLFFKGRIFNKRRIDLSNNVTYLKNNCFYQKDLNFLGKEIAKKVVNYNKLVFNYNNLLYNALNKIPFKTIQEEEEFEKNGRIKIN